MERRSMRGKTVIFATASFVALQFLAIRLEALTCNSCAGIPNCDCNCKELNCWRTEGGEAGIFCIYFTRARCSTMKLFSVNGDVNKECVLDSLNTTNIHDGVGCNNPQCTGCLDLTQSSNDFEDSCTQGVLLLSAHPTYLCKTKVGVGG